MDINLSSEFSDIIGFLYHVFNSVIHWLDSIIIIGDNTSLLDLNIAYAVFSVIFTAVFSVVHVAPVVVGDSVKVAREDNKARQQQIEKDLVKQREARLKEGASYNKT